MAGFGLNLNLVLYLQSQCLTESLGFLNPPLLQGKTLSEPDFALFLFTLKSDLKRSFCVV
jgi:hypothetical protein